MDSGWILPLALNVMLGIIAWLGKMTIDDMKKIIFLQEAKVEILRKELQDVHHEYVNKEDFRDFKSELYDLMDKNHNDLVRQINRHV